MKKIALFIILIGIVICRFSEAKEWITVDIQPNSNSKVDGGTQWWTGAAGGSTLQDLPKGKGILKGSDGDVPYNIGPGCIVLNGTNAPKWPKEAKGIKVEAAAEEIYFLHATGWEFPGAPSYKFIMNYEGGSKKELLIISHQNSDDWCHDGTPLPDKNSVWGWISKAGPPCGHAGLITTKWPNPEAAKVIKSIDIESIGTPAVPLIVGITLGGATKDVEAAGKLPITWGHIKSSY